MLLKDKLKDMQKEITQKASQIKENQKSCKLCNGSGVRKDKIILFGIEQDYLYHCECSEIDEKNLLMFREDYRVINRAFDFIEFQVPEEHKVKNGVDLLIITKDEFDFLNSTKQKVIWLHNREKGTGKTTRAYSLLAMSKTLNKYHTNFYEEANLKYDKFDKSYNVELLEKEIIVIDDIGVECDRNKQIALAKLYYQLFNRVRKIDSKIIITSQFSIKDFCNRMKSIEKYNEQLKSQLIEQAERIESRLQGISFEKQISIKG